MVMRSTIWCRSSTGSLASILATFAIVAGQDTFVLWHTNVACQQEEGSEGRVDLGEFASVSECEEACVEQGGDACKFFIFGKGLQFGQCWWEDDAPCTSGLFESDAYNLYRRPFALWQTDKECIPNEGDNGAPLEVDLDQQDSVAACESACIERGGSDCNYFIFGKGARSGQCWWEFDASCDDEGFQAEDYDIYRRVGYQPPLGLRMVPNAVSTWHDQCHAGEQARKNTSLRMPYDISNIQGQSYGFWNKVYEVLWLQIVVPIFFLAIVIATCILRKGAKPGEEVKTTIHAFGLCTFLAVWVLAMTTYLDQCHLGRHNALTVRIHRMKLEGKPTDDWWLDSEDEIIISAWSGICSVNTEEMTMKAHQTRHLDLRFRTYYDMPVTMNLKDADGGFEGKDDLSEDYKISSQQLSVFRYLITEGLVDHIDLEHQFLVKGGNIWSENEVLGFLADFACVSAVDFVVGPWTSRLFKVGLKGGKVAVKASNLAKLYQKGYRQYQTGDLTKKSFGKMVLAYQMREGAKKAVTQPAKDKLMEEAGDFLMSQTTVDDYVNQTLACWDAEKEEWYEEGKNYLNGQGAGGRAAVDMLEVGEEVNSELNRISDGIAQISDAMEFCLTDIGGGRTDAPYRLWMTVSL